MTREEASALEILIRTVERIEGKVDCIPSQTERAIAAALRLHRAEMHCNDAVVVGDVRLLMDERVVSSAFKSWCGHYWRQLIALAGGIVVVLEILEITHVI